MEAARDGRHAYRWTALFAPPVVLPIASPLPSAFHLTSFPPGRPQYVNRGRCCLFDVERWTFVRSENADRLVAEETEVAENRKIHRKQRGKSHLLSFLCLPQLPQRLKLPTSNLEHGRSYPSVAIKRQVSDLPASGVPDASQRRYKRLHN